MPGRHARHVQGDKPGMPEEEYPACPKEATGMPEGNMPGMPDGQRGTSKTEQCPSARFGTQRREFNLPSDGKNESGFNP